MPDYRVHKGYNVVEEYVIPESVQVLVGAENLLPGDAARTIVAGKTSDEVLALLPSFLMTRDPAVVGTDTDGLIVEWCYRGVIFTLAYAPSSYDAQYCVQQIQVRDVHNH